jgi:outer membrane protein assembly factor BamB
MSSASSSSPNKKPARPRRLFPRLMLLAAVATLTVLWAAPLPGGGAFAWSFGVWLVAQGALLVLLFWLIGYSGWRWWLRVPVAVLLLGASAAAAVRDVGFSGDMRPIVVRFRWQRSPADVLEAHRRRQAAQDVPAVTLAGDESDAFPEYRGRGRDGVVTGPPLARAWKAHPPKLLWRQPVGGGYASFAVAGNVAVTIEQRRQQEAVVCYDTATGQERWVHAYDASFVEKLGGPGPRATPTLAGGDVYSLGATGVLVCFDAATGKPRWTTNILEDNDNIHWGMSGSPLVYDNLVVVNPGSQRPSAKGRAVVAYDRATGQRVWAGGSAKAGYSSPMLATLAGQRQVLLLDGEGLAGYDPGNGTELWRFPWPTYQDINVAQPLALDGDRVFISSGYGVGCAMLRVKRAEDKWSVDELWRNKAMSCKFTSPVAYRGHVYGLDEGILACIDQETGDRKWKGGRYGHGQLLLADDLLVILAETGQLVLVEATPEAHRELASIPVFDPGDKTWNYPALAGGRAYLRTHLEMACYDLRAGGD